jgi:hypothetical protein
METARNALRHLYRDDMTMARFRSLCDDAGLTCTSQESLSWLSRLRNDCISIFTHPKSRWDLPLQMIHTRLGQEMDRAKVLSQLYRPPVW